MAEHIYLLKGFGVTADFFDTLSPQMAALFVDRGYRVVSAANFHQTLAAARGAGRFKYSKADGNATPADKAAQKRAEQAQAGLWGDEAA